MRLTFQMHANYDDTAGEIVLLDDSSPEMQCLLRTLECVSEKHELEEGIEVTKGEQA